MFYETRHQSSININEARCRAIATTVSYLTLIELVLAVVCIVFAPMSANATTPLHTEDSSFFPTDVTTAFGRAVAVYGDTAVIGDPEDDRDGNYAGAAWVFVRSGTNWVEQARLTPSGASAGDLFGSSVDIYENYIVVGAPSDTGAGATESGVAYVFRRDGTTWTEDAKLMGAAMFDGDLSEPLYMFADRFGASVAINGDIPADSTSNDIWYNIIVGSPGDTHSAFYSVGSAYGYQLSADGTAWNSIGKLRSNNPVYGDNFGNSVDLDGDHMIIGALSGGEDLIGSGIGNNPGVAYVYVRRGMLGNWNMETRLNAPSPEAQDFFGTSVAVSAYGGLATFVVGVPSDDDLGDQSGSAYVFVGSAQTFPQFAKLLASDGKTGDGFGTSIAVNNDGILVGSPWADSSGVWRSGAAYVYARQGATWTESERLAASSYNGIEQLGFSVAVTGTTAIAGSDEAHGSTSHGGAVLVFDDIAVGLFSDGFESGSTNNWSTTVP